MLIVLAAAVVMTAARGLARTLEPEVRDQIRSRAQRAEQAAFGVFSTAIAVPPAAGALYARVGSLAVEEALLLLSREATLVGDRQIPRPIGEARGGVIGPVHHSPVKIWAGGLGAADTAETQG